MADPIIAYAVVDDPPPLRKAQRERDWMEAAPHRFPYRCLPLVIGNQAGWDILNTIPFRARWNGGDRPSDVILEPTPSPPGDSSPLASAHFGQGVLTFSTGYLFRTPPGIGLLVCGPPNAPKDGIFALTGLVETDWSHATFTMNYRFTRRMHWVEFAADEPICRIIPIDRHLIDRLDGEIRPISDDAKLEGQYREWMQGRLSFNARLRNPFSEEARQGWQRDYFQGRSASGERIAGHQTQLHHREFADRRLVSGGIIGGRRPVRPVSRRDWQSAAQYLWENRALYDHRREKSASVLAGIVKLLASKRPLNGGEQGFLETFERVRRLSPEEFTYIWSEPRAHHWTRVAFELLDHRINRARLSPLTQSYLAELGYGDPSAALRRHLERFRLFELGAAIVFGHSLEWLEPLVVDLPCAFPGTRWTLTGEGVAVLLGHCEGQLRLDVDGRSQAVSLAAGRIPGTGVALVECDLLTGHGAEIRLQPEVMAGLGLAEAGPAVATGPDFRASAASLIASAMEQLARYDDQALRLLADETRVIAPKAAEGPYANTTFSSLPGAMILSLIPNPLEMADRIVHEVHHDRLFCIEEFHALLEEGLEDVPGVPRLYSPWRLDPRPARGVLHGLYVFIAVGRFWLKVVTASDAPEADREFAAQRLRMTVGQLTAAVRELERAARFTPFGSGVFDQLRDDVDALSRAVDGAGVPEDPQALAISDDGAISPLRSTLTGRPLSVTEALAEHRVLAARPSTAE